MNFILFPVSPIFSAISLGRTRLEEKQPETKIKRSGKVWKWIEPYGDECFYVTESSVCLVDVVADLQQQNYTYSLSLSVVLNCRRAIEVRENKLFIFVSRSLSAVISSSPTNFIPALSSFPSPPTITEPNFTSVLFRLRLYFIPCSIPSMADDAGGLISTSLEANLARGYAIETTRTRRH